MNVRFVRTELKYDALFNSERFDIVINSMVWCDGEVF